MSDEIKKLTAEEIEALAVLEKKATPGKLERFYVGLNFVFGVRTHGGNGGIDVDLVREDGDLLCALRNAAPALLEMARESLRPWTCHVCPYQNVGNVCTKCGTPRRDESDSLRAQLAEAERRAAINLEHAKAYAEERDDAEAKLKASSKRWMQLRDSLNDALSKKGSS